jgi:hypothetical protein
MGISEGWQRDATNAVVCSLEALERTRTAKESILAASIGPLQIVEATRSLMREAETPNLGETRAMRTLAIILAALSISGSAYADLYKFSVRRLESNFYELDRGKAYLITKYCYEYAFGDEAVVDDDSDEIRFDGGKCDIDKVLVPKTQSAGNYKVSVKREEDNFYELNFSGLYAKTSYCYEYTYGSDAVLSWNGYNGKLTFESGRTCPVSNLLSNVK